MRNEEQDVDEEGQQRDEKGGEGKDEQCKEIARRVRRRVKVGSDSKAEADEGHEGGDGMDDEDGREGMARG
jgi:hypothetical protein